MHADESRALARCVAALAGAVAGVPVPDALRAMVGPDDAERLLRAAGLDPAPAVREWRDVKAQRDRQAAESRQRTEALWAADPTHDERYVRALTDGASMRELDMIARSVRHEIEQSRPPTVAEKYAAWDREARQAAAAAASSRSQPLEPGQPQQHPAQQQQARPVSALPGS